MKAEPKNDTRWSSFYKVAAVTSLLIVIVGLVDITVSMMGGEAKANNAIPVEEWFMLFQTDRLTALGNLGLFNILTLSLGIPLYIALFNLNKANYSALATLAVTLFVMGTSIYISSNTVFSMQSLSNQYATASVGQKPILEAVGKVLLAQGADLSSGTFMGFLFTQLGGLLMAVTLMKSKVFGKRMPWFGMIGFGLMLVFFYIAAFIPGEFATAMIISAPGGIMLMVYQILMAQKFYQISR